MAKKSQLHHDWKVSSISASLHLILLGLLLASSASAQRTIFQAGSFASITYSPNENLDAAKRLSIYQDPVDNGSGVSKFYVSPILDFRRESSGNIEYELITVGGSSEVTLFLELFDPNGRLEREAAAAIRRVYDHRFHVEPLPIKTVRLTPLRRTELLFSSQGIVLEDVEIPAAREFVLEVHLLAPNAEAAAAFIRSVHLVGFEVAATVGGDTAFHGSDSVISFSASDFWKAIEEVYRVGGGGQLYFTRQDARELSKRVSRHVSSTRVTNGNGPRVEFDFTDIALRYLDNLGTVDLLARQAFTMQLYNHEKYELGTINAALNRSIEVRDGKYWLDEKEFHNMIRGSAGGGGAAFLGLFGGAGGSASLSSLINAKSRGEIQAGFNLTDVIVTFVGSVPQISGLKVQKLARDDVEHAFSGRVRELNVKSVDTTFEPQRISLQPAQPVSDSRGRCASGHRYTVSIDGILDKFNEWPTGEGVHLAVPRHVRAQVPVQPDGTIAAMRLPTMQQFLANTTTEVRRRLYYTLHHCSEFDPLGALDWTGFTLASCDSFDGSCTKLKLLAQAALAGWRVVGESQLVPPISYRRPPTAPEKVDCKVHTTSWGPCSATACGSGGLQTRSVSVVQDYANGGEGCPQLGAVVTKCKATPCPVDCAVKWSKWGPCSKVCGTGAQQRSAEVTRSPQYGGAKCPALKKESRACNSMACSFERCRAACGSAVCHSIPRIVLCLSCIQRGVCPG